MNCENKIKIFKVNDTETVQTSEGVMKPFMFADNVSLIHLEIPAGMEVSPHAHPKEGHLYCLSGELEVFSEDQRFTINQGTAIVVPANLTVGVNNKSDTAVECLLISAPPTVKSVPDLKIRIKQYQDKEDK